MNCRINQAGDTYDVRCSCGFEALDVGDLDSAGEVRRLHLSDDHSYDLLRAHMIAEHGFEADDFDGDALGGPITDVATLRYLHEPWSKEKGHRESDLLEEAS